MRLARLCTRRERFEYNAQGLVSSHTRIVAGHPYTMETTYDSLNRPLTVTYPGGEEVMYSYDREGEETLEAGSDDLVTGLAYNERGQLVTVTRGNGITTTNSYKPASGNFRLSQALVKDGSSNLMGQAYGYDKVGNITSITDQVATDVQSFTYDPLNRLSTASGTLSAAAYDWRYGYEESGNIDYVVKDGQTTDYGYSAAQHQAVEELIVGGEPVGSFAYDANGNMISRTITDTVTTTYTQEFDVENRLITVTVASEVTVFAYDAGGQRVMTVEPDGTVIYTPFNTYEEEVASGGATTRRSYYLLGGQPIALRVSSSPSDPDDGLYFIHGDHLGSTGLLTDAQGEKKGGLIRYYPFGEYRVGPTTELTDRGYTGQQENSYIKQIGRCFPEGNTG
jgi:uncharacterized protein RhaS with RHS repeats